MRFFPPAGSLFLFLCILAGCGGVPAVPEFDVLSRVQDAGYATAPVSPREWSALMHLQRAHPHWPAVRSLVLLQKNDRVAAIFWVHLPDAPTEFVKMKAFLFPRLSTETKDLYEATLREEAPDPIPFFSFYDPKLHDERILLAVINGMLFEFHITEGNEGVVRELLLGFAE